MKKATGIVVAMVVVFIAGAAWADQYVRGYTRRDGTYVHGYYRTEPNQYRHDNYSSRGNVNPYTGERGYERNEYTDPPVYNKSYGKSYGRGLFDDPLWR